MNIALVLQHKLLLGIQRFMQSGPRATQAALAPAGSCADSWPPAPVRKGATTAASMRQAAPRAIPLRVLHEVETGMPPTSTGRLVISGRMADVCAELDRLVEREAALH